MTNGGDAHGRTGKKKPGGKKARQKGSKPSLKGKSLLTAGLDAGKTGK
jgi:hypothetical protein